MAAIYGVIVLVLNTVLTQRDGYSLTYASLRETFKRATSCFVKAGKGTKSGGAYVSKVPPKYGWPQLLRNMLFWCIVLLLKVCPSPFGRPLSQPRQQRVNS